MTPSPSIAYRIEVQHHGQQLDGVVGCVLAELPHAMEGVHAERRPQHVVPGSLTGVLHLFRSGRAEQVDDEIQLKRWLVLGRRSNCENSSKLLT